MTPPCCSGPARCSPSRPRSRPRSWRRCSRPTAASRSPAPSTRCSAAASRSPSARSCCPAHPARMVREAAAPVLAELAAVLEDVAAALRRRDRDAVQAALERGRAIDDLARDLEEALTVGRETARLAPPRRRRARHGRRLRRRRGADRPRGPQRPRPRRGRAPGDRPRGERPARGRRRAPPLADAVRALGGARRPARAGAVREPALRAAGAGDARARADRQPVGLGDRRPGALDRGRPAARLGDVLRGGRRRGPDAGGSGGGRVGPATSTAAARGGRRPTGTRPPYGWQAGHQYVVRPPIVSRATAPSAARAHAVARPVRR